MKNTIDRSFWIQQDPPRGRYYSVFYFNDTKREKIRSSLSARKVRQTSEKEAQLIGSRTGLNLHAPALDLDFPAKLKGLDGGRSLLTIVGPRPTQRKWNELLKVWLACNLVDATFLTEAFVVNAKRGKRFDLPPLALVVPARIIASSTPGHHHLYIDKEMVWSEYANLLTALSNADVIGKDFYRMCIKSEQSFLLKPGLRKKDLLTS